MVSSCIFVQALGISELNATQCILSVNSKESIGEQFPGPRRFSTLRSGASEIWITPSNGRSRSNPSTSAFSEIECVCGGIAFLCCRSTNGSLSAIDSSKKEPERGR